MTTKILYWATVVSAALALLLLIVNVSLIGGNQRLQAAINQKQMTINTAQAVLPLNQQLSQALYQASMKKDGEKIRGLLTSQGFVLPAKEEAAKTDAAKK